MNEKSSSMPNKISQEEALYHLLKKERTYYQTLLEITRQENVLLKIPAIMPGWRAITPLLKQKRVLLESIQEIEQVIQPLKTYWHNKTHGEDTFSTKVHKELKILNHLLEEILDLDTNNQEQMKKQLLKLKQHKVDQRYEATTDHREKDSGK